MAMHPSAVPAQGISRGARMWVTTLVIALTYQAYRHRFIQDDAFISYRYAEHLAQGHGLVWNVGEAPIEGFTNFLWTLLLALCHALGADVETSSWLLGLAFYAGTLACTWMAVLRISWSEAWASGAILVLGLNYSFRAYATGGLETSLQTFLFTAATLVLVSMYQSACRVAELGLLSVVLGAVLATRFDGALIAVPFGWTALMALKSVNVGARHRRRALLALVAPGLIIVGSLLLFKLAYFGDIFPNTFYVKGTTSDSIRAQGAHYVWAFLREYWLAPAMLVALATVRRWDLGWTPRMALGVSLMLWTGYVIYIGGDFMEFRMLVPVLPLLSCFCAYAARLGRRASWAFSMLGAITTLASVNYELRYREAFWVAGVHDVETIHSLAGHVDDPAQDWRGVGRALKREFQGQPITIAVAAAGAIPYYSGLRTIDLHGLNDRWVAHHGRPEHIRPGHQRLAPLSYLVAQRVNLVVHPWSYYDAESSITRYGLREMQRYIAFKSLRDLPTDAKIIEFPVNDVRRLRVLYLVRDRRIDRKIAKLGWHIFNPTQE